MSSRDRIVGAVFVLIVLAAQTFWMGPAIVLLSGGLVVAYVVWAAARWKDDPAAVLLVYLFALAVQCLHFTEEYVTGFQHQFPELFGDDWNIGIATKLMNKCTAIPNTTPQGSARSISKGNWRLAE